MPACASCVHRPLTGTVACTGPEADKVHRRQQGKAQSTTATEMHKASHGGSKGISAKQDSQGLMGTLQANAGAAGLGKGVGH